IAPLARVTSVVDENGFVYPADSYNATLTENEDGDLIIAIDWSPDGPEPAAGAFYVVEVTLCAPPRLAGVEKHTVGTVGSRTSGDTEAVDGYSAIPWIDLF